jgi:hypothetical protein
MRSGWRRGCLLVILTCCIALGAAGTLVFAGYKTRRLAAPPAELLSLGPVWVGDFCRDNVAHHRYPPGWCPRNYTVYVILRTDFSSAIYPIFEIPERVR